MSDRSATRLAAFDPVLANATGGWFFLNSWLLSLSGTISYRKEFP